MGYSDGRKQLWRILGIVERLQKSNGIRVRDLANFYEVDMTRIYDDLKIIKDFYELKKDKGSYWIEPVHPLRWPRITSEEAQVLELVITASPLAKGHRFETSLKSVLEKLDTSLAKHIQSKLQEDVPAQLDRVNNGMGVLEQKTTPAKGWATYSPSWLEDSSAYAIVFGCYFTSAIINLRCFACKVKKFARYPDFFEKKTYFLNF